MTEVTETARARVARLSENWDWPDPAILEDILALGDDAVPALAERLTPETLASAETDEGADAIVYYALELLSALRTPTAIPVFVNAYRQVNDEMAEGMEDALRRLGSEAIEPLISIAADPALTWYARALAANGAVHEIKQDPARREQVGEGLRAIIAGYMERPEPLTDEEKDVVATFITDLSELAYEPARGLIEAAFDADRVLHPPQGRFDIPIIDRFDIPIIDREGVADLYEKGGRPYHREPRNFLEEYRERRHNHFEQEQSRARLAALEQEKAPQPVVLSRKLGRNDPCWCGSGQKYKKCHLAQDEKEKVRL